MNVLSKLTKEYLGDTLRDEKGKFLNIMGCKVIVHRNCRKFYESFINIYRPTSVFYRKRLLE